MELPRSGNTASIAIADQFTCKDGGRKSRSGTQNGFRKYKCSPYHGNGKNAYVGDAFNLICQGLCMFRKVGLNA